MVTQSLLNQYRREVESASNDARNYLTAMCEAYIDVNPNATVADMRKFAIETLQDGLYLYGDQAKVIANDFFDRLAQQAGSKATAEMFDSTDADMVEQKVRYYAKAMAEGDTSKFIKDVSDLTGYYVKREAFCNMAKNCKKSGIRYARVPSGRETCAFCFMLASRGFVYWTEADAGASGHEYHPHCDCIIVPGFNSGNWNLKDMDGQVEGYNPSELYKRYNMCVNTVRGTSGIAPSTKEILDEIKTRDTQWLWTGKEPSVVYPDDHFVAKKIKENKEHELRTAQRIANNGIKVEFIYDEKIDKTKPLHTTTGYADFANGYEIKTPMEAKSEYSAVKNAYEKTVGKIGVKRLIIDNYEAINLTDKEMMKQIKEQNLKYSEFDWVSMIDKKGTLLDVVKKK